MISGLWEKHKELPKELARLFLCYGAMAVVAKLLEVAGIVEMDEGIRLILAFVLRAIDKWLHEQAPKGEAGGLLGF